MSVVTGRAAPGARAPLTSTFQIRSTGDWSYALIMREPDRALTRITVTDLLEIGRSRPGTAGLLSVRHGTMSRRHARLQMISGNLTITDLGSMNGTKVNGERITATTRLALGDIVAMGAVTMVVVAASTGATTTEAAPPPSDPTWAGTLAAAAAPQRTVESPAPSGATEKSGPSAKPAAPGKTGALAPATPATPGAKAAPAAPAAPAAKASPAAKAALAAKARPFPTYLQLRRWLPLWVWHVARAISVTGLIGLCVLLVVRPTTGLYVMWRIIAPTLPLLFIVGPGLWRNICPLAAGNQVPRLFRFTRSVTPPRWLKQRGYLVGVIGFLALVANRRLLFDHNGPATAAMLAAALVSAFTGGTIFAGKSGWCSSICPLFPVQRLYGQTPFVTVPNSHCRPCVGCAKNCYDFNPRVAYQADMHDDDPRWTAPRKFFAGSFPGVVLGYWTVNDPSLVRTYLTFLAYVLVSAGSFFALEALVRISASRLAGIYGGVALTTFYWFGAPGVSGVVHDVAGTPPSALIWPIRAAVAALALVWIVRTFRVERLFVRYSLQAQPVHVPANSAVLKLAASTGGAPEVTFQPQDRRVVASAGASLLDIAEKDGLPIEAGCRMGLCGADPVAVLAGAENLSACGDDEADTLRRLGFGGAVRLACCARVSGPVTVSLDPHAAPASGVIATEPPRAPADPTIRSVVVLGNGIAGVTAAEEVRRGHPSCEVHVVGREIHPLYNRMGIARLVYGRSALAGMFLLAEDWYTTRNITCWLNTRAAGIDLTARQVTLGTGERLDFDRLILATGGRGSVPTIPGMGMPGSFVLREAADAFAIRGYVQEHGATTAVVLGGGPLGIEAAHALAELGLAVQLLHRGDQLLRQYIDPRCAARLGEFLLGRGIALMPNADIAELVGPDRVRSVALGDGEHLAADVALICTGVISNTELATAAGIAVNRGILVDSRMRTSESGVFAAGDVAELGGQIPGLWPTAVAQGRVAARNALGERDQVQPKPIPMLVKGIGIHLVSAGRLTPEPGDEVLVRDVPEAHSYTRLVVSAGHVVGAVVLGAPDEAPDLLAAVETSSPIQDVAATRTGTWRPG
jgi:NADPH-dependent 2,4-dienoyl-CoA reductase/sulfur reductase-like enzyme/ferredoxin